VKGLDKLVVSDDQRFSLNPFGAGREERLGVVWFRSNFLGTFELSGDRFAGKSAILYCQSVVQK
jgi:hypothetical protein